MEMLKYKSDGLKALAMLLLQLRLDIQETDILEVYIMEEVKK